jgi:hypothetical protein
MTETFFHQNACLEGCIIVGFFGLYLRVEVLSMHLSPAYFDCFFPFDFPSKASEYPVCQELTVNKAFVYQKKKNVYAYD